ncbi:Glu-tRNA(Gln) amidotransferase subunit GatD [Nanoarchaeota archaeon]
MNANPGDRIEVRTAEESYEGVLMPSESKDSIFLKLNNGYNVGISKEKIRSIKTLEKAKAVKEEKPKPVKENKKLPTISILHTGGTIASKVDYKTGAVVAKFKPEELLSLFPELEKIANIRSILISNLQSENMRFAHYNLIANAIEKELKNKPKGIIITHGTDTMHYTSAALSLILEGIDVPVILVGAQRSSDRGSSDSATNMISAAKFIANTKFKGVGICMHSDTGDESAYILPAMQTRKLHTSRRDAFNPINSTPIAEVFFNKDEIRFIDKKHYMPSGDFKLRLFGEDIKIGILRSHTNIMPEDISYFKNHKGLIIEGTGLGHFQTTSFDDISKINEKNKLELSKIIKNGCTVVLTSQCVFGRVDMNVYSPQRELLDIGVIPGDAIPTDTAFIKLAWVLSNYKDDIEKVMLQNLRGENPGRIQEDEYM